ncbi:cytidylyltransferase domain-containing protein [Bacillus sp. NPDC077027]|uniref:acylneuraminate cytidylyltransferase family protein n=1 Tax=Bacillus sp. NPDC077027 TaxID=3390548 RepID=UPI003D011D0D
MFMGKRVLALIPAKGETRDIPYQHIRLLKEKPLIYWTIKPLFDMTEVDEIVVSSDDLNIQIVSSHFGANVIERTKEQTLDKTPSLATVKHALAYLEREGKTFDIVLYLQPTSPLRQVDDVYQCIDLLLDGDFDCVATFSKALEDPNETWMLQENKEATLYKDNHQFFMPKQQKQLPYYRLNGAVYAFHAAYAKDCVHSFLEGTVGAHVMEQADSLEIKCEGDFDKAEKLIRQRHEASSGNFLC